jgi:DNA polymerase III delta subunit
MQTLKTKPNIYLFYGEDDFSLRRKVDSWKQEFAKKFGAAGVIFFDAQNFSSPELVNKLTEELSPSLFAAKKLIIVRDCLPRKADQTNLADFLLGLSVAMPPDCFLVFWETSKPDKRLGFTKKFLSLVNVTEFELPHGIQLNLWLSAMAKNLEIKISPEAVELLAQFLGRDLFEEKKFGGKVVERKEAFDLWQAYSELTKLAASGPARLASESVAGGGEVTKAQVAALVKPKISDSVFALTDQIVARNRQGAFQALENFLAGSNIDEKQSFIKIVGLLSEQLRSLLAVLVLSQAKLSNDQIAEKLGWTAGRVFITLKNSKNFPVVKLKQLLNKLLLIDVKLKSSEADPKLMMDLFLSEAVE